MTLKSEVLDFAQIPRSRSLSLAVDKRLAIEAASHALLKSLLPLRSGVRLLGVSLPGLQLERGFTTDDGQWH